MHECGNLIQHEGEPRGLYVVTHECINIGYRANMSGVVDLPHGAEAISI